MNRRNLIKEMYIIKSGKVNKISEDGQIVLKMLNEGSVLGQLAIMNLTNNKHSTSIRSCGYVDVSVLKQDDVSELLCDYPEERQKLLKKGFIQIFLVLCQLLFNLLQQKNKFYRRPKKFFHYFYFHLHPLKNNKFHK